MLNLGDDEGTEKLIILIGLGCLLQRATALGSLYHGELWKLLSGASLLSAAFSYGFSAAMDVCVAVKRVGIK